MEVASLYADPKRWPVLSAETFPPENFRPIDPLLPTVEELLPHGISVVTTTWGALGSARGGTPSVSRIIHEKFNIPTVVHFSTQAKTRKDIEGLLRGLYLDGLHNILALGGDPPAGVADYVPAVLRHRYASDLVEQLVHMNQRPWMDQDGKYTRTGVKTLHGGSGAEAARRRRARHPLLLYEPLRPHHRAAKAPQALALRPDERPLRPDSIAARRGHRSQRTLGATTRFGC